MLWTWTKGPANFGIRELTGSEQLELCATEHAFYNGGPMLNQSSPEEPPYLDANHTLAFNSDFEIRIFLSGCYYFDLPTGLWKSDGMEIMRDTTAQRYITALKSDYYYYDYYFNKNMLLLWGSEL